MLMNFTKHAIDIRDKYIYIKQNKLPIFLIKDFLFGTFYIYIPIP